MKLTKKLETEILKAYNGMWEAYIKGDMKTFASFMHDKFQIIGTADKEIFHNKKAALKFYTTTANQVTNTLQMRNRNIRLTPIENNVMINEYCDLFVLIDKKWTFYGPARITTLYTKTNGKWQNLHQHGSLPDARTSEGEQFAAEKIKKENLQLKEAVKRRTVELEEKNRELEIEKSLEKVRAVAMGMKKAEDLLNICRIVYKELTGLGFDELRNALIHTFNDEQKFFYDYDYSDLTSGAITRIPYSGSPVIKKFLKDIRKGKTAFSEIKVGGKQLTDWKKFRKANNEIDDPRLDNIKALYYYIYSVGAGSIGISTYKPVTDEMLMILKRFRNVFDLSYQRYQDIEKAEAQAREAQIEAALERVRSKAMSMFKSTDLSDASSILFNELKTLGITFSRAGIGIISDESRTVQFYSNAPSKEGSSLKLIGGIMMKGHKEFENQYKYWKKKQNYFTSLSGKSLKSYYDFLSTGINITRDWISTSAVQYGHWLMFSHGFLFAWHNKKYSDEEIALLDRFKSVIEITFRRYFDLQKAEAQARESQIQLALERVRARTMAMQKSDELADAASLMFEQISSLGIETWTSGFNIWEKEDSSFIGYNPTPTGGITAPYHIPSTEDNFFKIIYEAKKRKEDFLVFESKGKSLATTYRYMKTLPVIKDVLAGIEEAGIQLPTAQVNHCVFFSHGFLLFITLESQTEAHDIFRRFGKVFEQTYTRFLDLQKAEAQAREAQIEAALERVRTRAMAMHKSEDLDLVVATVFEELGKLNLGVLRCGVGIFNKEKRTGNVWSSALSEEGNTLQISGNESFDIHPLLSGTFDSWLEQKDFAYELEGNDLFAYYGELAKTNKKEKRKQYYYTPMFDAGNLYAFSELPFSEDAKRIMKRFASVLNLTYNRFLDLQKAEAQALEAQIQLALERVRARTMAMHKSDELPETSHILFEQMNELGEPAEQLTIGIVREDFNVVEISATLHGDTLKKVYNHSIDEPYMMNKVYKAWKSNKKTLIVELKGEELNAYNQYRNELTHSEMFPTNLGDENRRIVYAAFFSKGMLALGTNEPRPPQSLQLLERFASVFDLTYTRFLDLQKAEAQAREAQIEAALERVRSRSMAMHKTDELFEAAELIYKELTALNITSFNVSYAFVFEDKNQDEYYGVNPMDGKIFPFPVIFPQNETPVMSSIMRSWKKNEPFNLIELDENGIKNHQTYIGEHILAQLIKNKIDIPFSVDEFVAQSPETAAVYSFNYTSGYLFMIREKKLTADEELIVLRFTKVFNQTYTRFLDLKKAEAQAREAQIETALERVRSRSIGMQKSDELKEVIQVVYEQFTQLNVHIDHAGFVVDYQPKGNWHFWVADQHAEVSEITVPWYDNQWGRQFDQAKEKGENFYATLLNFEEKNKFYNDLLSLIPDIPDEAKQFYLSCPGLAISTVLMDKVALYIENFDGKPYSEEENAILLRFAKVFEQSYTRFLDLQKAEAQAREAQIEAALEKVRSASLAMQTTNELGEVVKIIVEKLKDLGVVLDANGVVLCTYFQDSKDVLHWIVSPDFSFTGSYLLPYFDHPIFKAAWESKESGEAYFSKAFTKEEKDSFFQYAFEHSDYKHFPDDFKQWVFQNDKHILSFAWQKNSAILIPSHTGVLPTEEQIEILKRFAKVFEQSYTRFLDLKKAEALTRETQIELSLERIRSQAMAMQQSTDLLDIVVTMRSEFEKLGHEAHYFWHMRWLPEKYEKAMTSGDGTRIGMVMELPRRIHGEIPLLAEWEKGNEPIVVYAMNVEETLDYVHKMVEWGDFQQVDPNMPTEDDIRHIGGLTYVMARTMHGEIGYSLPGMVPDPPEDDIRTLKRFAGVFDLAYRRFEDLKKAEQRNRETQIELALEKVRNRTMAMQHSDELPEAANLLFLEVQAMGIPLWSAGYNILSADKRSSTCIMSSEGELQIPFKLPLTEHKSLQPWHNAIINKEDFFVNEQGGDELVEHYQYMGSLPELASTFKQLADAGLSLPTFQVNHLVRFSEGFLLFITYERVPHAHDIFKRFASVFEQAYIRFTDLQTKEEQAAKIVAEKTRLEKTLGELQTTQKQLIQSEKMASLGELTAGIAHEIQNPLNFVNNFSEVSNELLDEMLEAAAKGDFDEVKVILNDVRQNLEKINHHGKRADGIVKGMLQHSRTSSGTKEPTDINALADEYLRLAYHGLRAKDKSFNATMKTEFDEGLKKVSVIPQDMGRVILNLITNAFYAVAERKKHQQDGFEPTVIVSTKKTQDRVEVRVKDNGNGIPDALKEKIFQPFFTTKPTGEGTGLGLSLAYDIITKGHEGSLSVQSATGTGSEFIITIPYN